MRKRSLILLVLVLVLISIAMLYACNTDSQSAPSQDLGTYYLFDGTQLDPDSYIELKSGNKWYDGESEGKFTLKDGKITLFDGDDELMSGTLSNGVLKLEFMGMESVFKKGTPGTKVDPNPDNPKRTEYSVRFFLNDGTENSITKETENQLITYTPTRSGYIFNGWWFSSGNTENGAPILTKRWNMEQKVEDDSLVLYAEWVFAPTEDAQLPAPSVSVDGYRYSWDSISGANGYNVILKKGNDVIEEIKSLKSTYWDFKQSNDAGTYTLEIRANGDGIKTINSSYTVKNISHKILGKLSSFSFDKKTATISWGVVEGATSYDVWCDGVCLLADTTVKTYVLTNIDAGKRRVTIMAKRDGWQTSYNYYDIEKDMLKTPSDVNAIFDYDNMTYTFSWEAVKGIAGSEIVYKIYNGTKFLTQTDKTTYVVQQSDWRESENVKNIQVVSFDTSANTIQSIPSDKIEIKKMVEIEFLSDDAAAGTIEAKRIVNDINITFNYNYKDCPEDVVQVLNESNRAIEYFTPQRSGYVFLGWFKDKAGTKRFDFASAVSEDTTLYALWQDIDDSTSILELNEEKYIYTGTTLKKYAFVPMKAGDFTFYFKNESGMRTNIIISQGVSTIYSPMYQTTTSLTEKTISLDAYQVVIIGVQATSENYRGYFTFGLSGNALPDVNSDNFAQGNADNKIVAPVGTEIELTANANLGYTWLGWYNGDVKVSEDTSFSYKLTVPNTYKKYTAKWNMNSEMSVFDFTSTPMSCTINGLKDKTTTDIFIPEYVTSISDDSFSGRTDITSISGSADMVGIVAKQANPTTFSANITSGTTIGDYFFDFYNSRRGVTCVTIPDSVTSIGSSAFYGCKKLTSISVATGNTKYHSEGNCIIETKSKRLIIGCKNSIIPVDGSVTSIGGSAFRGCTGLTSITIPDSVMRIDSFAFDGCTGLTSITIPDSVTSIGNVTFEDTAWYNKQPNGLVYVGKVVYKYKGTMPNNTSIVLKDGTLGIGDYAFKGCTGLTSITIPGSVTSIGYGAFSGCTGLTSATIGNVTSIGQFAFSGCTGLTSVTIPDSVTSIDSFAFDGCTGLTSISGSAEMVSVAAKQASPTSFVANITSGGSIGAYAFYNCSGLTSVVIPESVTSIGGSAFRGCTGLTSITIPDSVTSIGSGAFDGCTGLTSITIPDSVTSIGTSGFSGCTGLTTVNWNATECTSAGSNLSPIFNGCTNLTTVNIGDNVTTIPSFAFYGCTGLTSITIPDSVTSIGVNAFAGCTGLSSVTIGSGVTSIGSSAFYGCTGLTSVTILDSVTSIGQNAFDKTAWYNNQPDGLVYAGKVVYKYKGTMPNNTSIILKDGTLGIAGSAFNDCTDLTSVTIPNSVTSIGSSAFYNCTGLTDIYYTGDIVGWCGISGLAALMSYGSSSKTLYFGGNKVEGELIIPNSVTSIGSFAFYGCIGLTSITIPDSVTSIGAGTFSDCSGLTSITIPDSVTSIEREAFCYCTGLTSITIPGSVTSIGDGAFWGCSGLTNITIPDSVTSIGSGAFYGCSGLKSIYYAGDVAGWCGISGLYNLMSYGSSSKTLYIGGNKVEGELIITDSVTSIGSGAFYGCIGLTSVTIGSGVTSIGTYAFNGCGGLTSITIPDSVTSIGSDAFRGCIGLTSIYYTGDVAGWCGISGLAALMCYGSSSKTLYFGGNKVEGELIIPNSVTSIGSSAFYNCTGLTSVTIGSGVTSIGSGAFSWCTGLTSITIPDSVTSIGDYAFRGCTGLTSIVIPDSVTSISSYAFGVCSGLTSMTIPDSVTSIGAGAFGYCSGLTSINYSGTKAQWESIIKGSGWKYNVPSLCNVVCSDGTISI